MEGKIINCGIEAQRKVIDGVIKAAQAVQITLGPAGKATAINNGFGVDITRDGLTIQKSLTLSDPEMAIGANLVKKASINTEEETGDASTSVCILTKEMCVKGQKAINSGVNVNEMKSGMLKAGEWLANYIKNAAIPVDGDLEKIRKVATISANNSEVIGDLVVESMKKVGTHGVITADVGNSLEHSVDITTGMKLSKGYTSPHYATDPTTGLAVLEDPYIITIGQKVSSVNQIYPVLQKVIPSGRPFVLICTEIDQVPDATIQMNTLQGSCRAVVITAPDFGDARINKLADIAVFTGATMISPETGLDLKDFDETWLGSAKKVVVDKSSTIIYEGAGNPDAINKRAEIIEARLKDPTTTSYDKSKFEDRLAGLTGGVSIIKAGGASEVERVNIKQIIEDSIKASKSAIEEGVVPGSGFAILHGSQELKKDKNFWKDLSEDEAAGAKIVIESLPVIMRTVASNAGVNGDVVVEKVLESKRENYGFNAKTKKYGNLLDEGILDSAKVVRCALKNAISAASMILLIDCTIVDEPATKE